MQTKFTWLISDGVTVRFPDKPPDHILALLKANGFHLWTMAGAGTRLHRGNRVRFPLNIKFAGSAPY